VAQAELLQSKLSSLLENCGSHPNHSDLHWELMAKHAATKVDADGEHIVNPSITTSDIQCICVLLYEIVTLSELVSCISLDSM
jgi:hypothetical protein